jgi:hypothetical protein
LQLAQYPTVDRIQLFHFSISPLQRILFSYTPEISEIRYGNFPGI